MVPDKVMLIRSKRSNLEHKYYPYGAVSNENDEEIQNFYCKIKEIFRNLNNHDLSK